MSAETLPLVETEQKPLLSGAALAPTQVWRYPSGATVEGHCGCYWGRKAAEQAYATRHHSEVPR